MSTLADLEQKAKAVVLVEEQIQRDLDRSGLIALKLDIRIPEHYAFVAAWNPAVAQRIVGLLKDYHAELENNGSHENGCDAYAYGDYAANPDCDLCALLLRFEGEI